MGEEPIDFTAALAREGYGAGGVGPERVSPGAYAGCVALLLAVFAAGAGLYWIEWAKVGLLTGLGVVAYGAFAGWTAFVAYRLLRRPSPPLAFAFCCAFCGAALFADWFWYFYFDAHEVVADPLRMARQVWGLVDTRTVAVTFNGRHGRSSQVEFRGMLLLAAYVGEIVSLAATTGLVFRAGDRRSFFCRVCGRWGRTRFTLKNLYLLVPESHAYRQLADGDVSSLLSASPVPEARATPVQVHVRHCADCRRGAMWVSRVEGFGRGPRYRRKAVPVPRLQRVELTPDAVRSLLELARRERNAEVFES